MSRIKTLIEAWKIAGEWNNYFSIQSKKEAKK